MAAVRSIAIIGAGELGGALARQIAAADIARRIILVDDAAAAAAGKALDISQAAPVDGYTTHVSGTGDEAAAVGADAIVFADRFDTGAEWQGDTGSAAVRRLTYLNREALVLCAGARQMELVERGVREGGIDRRQLLGSAPEALRAAVVSLTTLEAGCAPADVALTVVGRPPMQIIVPWDDASIAGRSAVHVLPPPAISRLDARLARLWPPGPFALASAAARTLRAAATRVSHTVTAFVVLPDDDELRGKAGMFPVTMNSRGIAAIKETTLSTRNRVRLASALER